MLGDSGGGWPKLMEKRRIESEIIEREKLEKERDYMGEGKDLRRPRRGE